MSKVALKVFHRVARVVCAVALLCAAPARGAAVQRAGKGRCPEVRRCLDLLEDGIDFVESGRWDAASVVLEEVIAGLEGRPSYARDLARAYVYLGVARLQIADADETRQLFAAARLSNPTLELGVRTGGGSASKAPVGRAGRRLYDGRPVLRRSGRRGGTGRPADPRATVLGRYDQEDGPVPMAHGDRLAYGFELQGR
ncbi:MAG: hypothetical protein OXG04_26745 [Acidobacteria bacterium]|nr:hypothetical protein [Acidobacteriota bacterium]